MDKYIPLLQSILWIALIVFLIQIFRKEISLVRKAVATRLEEGDSVELGPIKLGEIRRVAKQEANGTNQRRGK